MRSYQPQDGDTLRSIARNAYYVYDDQGNEDLERGITVVRELIKWNSPIQKDIGYGGQPLELRNETVQDIWDIPFREQPQSQHSLEGKYFPLRGCKKIYLPDIPGINRYASYHQSLSGWHWHNIRRWRWLYLVLWSVGILLGGVFLFDQYYGEGPAPGHLAEWFGQILNNIWPWLTIWTLSVWMIWLVFRPANLSPVRQTRLRFLLIWIVGLVVLIPGLGPFIDIFLPRAAPLVAQYTDVFPQVIIWSSLIFLVYLYLSDGSVMHAEYLVPHRAIWTTLTLMLMGTVLAGYVGYQQVRDRIHGELSALTLADKTLQQLRASTRVAADGVNNLLRTSQSFDQPLDDEQRRELTQKWQSLKLQADTAAMQARDAQSFVQAAIKHYGSDKSLASISPATGVQGRTTTLEQNLDVEYIQQQMRALGQISTVLTATVTTTSELARAFAQFPTDSDPQVALGGDIPRLAQDAALKADVAAASITGLAFDGLPIFLWNGVLFAVLVLFPWLLLLLFLYRKRTNLAAHIYDDLDRLDPNHGLLRRVLEGSSTSREQKRVQQILRSKTLASPDSDSTIAGPGQTSDAYAQSIMMPALAKMSSGTPGGVAVLARPAAHASGTQPATDRIDSRAGATASDEQQTHDVNEIINLLATRTFSEFEYLISLIFLTLLLAAGWYYVFYPQSSIGLTNLIARGSSVRQLIGFITENLTPLTIGFTGAYFFLMQMLVRRYLSNDLYPAAFLQAAQRLLLIYILSLALTVLPLPFEQGQGLFDRAVTVPGIVALIAGFLAGIFPSSGLQLIITTFNRWQHRSVFPATLVPEPLTKLTGVTIWVEARFLEENIESIQAMATASIEQLIVRTHFPTSQIVDWIDQAILYLHAGHAGEWFPQLRAVGIRGASDLLDAAGLNLLDPYASLQESSDPKVRHEFLPDDRPLQRLVAAITKANASGVPRLDEDDPRGIAAAAIIQLLQEADSAAQQAVKATKLIEVIDLGRPETFDRVQCLHLDLDVAKKTLSETTAAFDRLVQEVGTLGDGDQKNKLLTATSLLKRRLEEATAMLTELGSLIQGETLASFKQNKLNLLKQRIEGWAGILDELSKILDGIAPTRTSPAEETPALGTNLASKTADVRMCLKEADESVRKVDRLVQAFDLDRRETLDARLELGQTTTRLVISRQILSDALEDVRAAIESDKISKTPAQAQTITSALDDTDPTIKTLQQAARDADNYARSFQSSPTLAAAPPTVDKGVAMRIGQAFEDARAKAQCVSLAAAAITQPPQLTPEILFEICDTIWPDPNISYILNFHQRMINDLNKNPREV